MKYRKRPVVIDAVQFTGTNFDEIFEWADALTDDVPPMSGNGDQEPKTLTISTPEGDMCADVGDWIICGIASEFYPCKPAIFAATYEPA